MGLLFRDSRLLSLFRWIEGCGRQGRERAREGESVEDEGEAPGDERTREMAEAANFSGNFLHLFLCVWWGRRRVKRVVGLGRVRDLGRVIGLGWLSGLRENWA